MHMWFICVYRYMVICVYMWMWLEYICGVLQNLNSFFTETHMSSSGPSVFNCHSLLVMTAITATNFNCHHSSSSIPPFPSPQVIFHHYPEVVANCHQLSSLTSSHSLHVLCCIASLRGLSATCFHSPYNAQPNHSYIFKCVPSGQEGGGQISCQFISVGVDRCPCAVLLSFVVM